MTNDKLSTARSMLQLGQIDSFNQLFKYCHKTILARELNITPNRMNGLIIDTAAITVAEIDHLSEIFNVDLSTILSIVKNEYYRQLEKGELKNKRPYRKRGKTSRMDY